MRALIVLVFVLLPVMFFVGFMLGRSIGPSANRLRRIEAENADLRQDESPKLQGLRQELQEYSDMTDNVVGQLGRQANGLDVTATAQDTLQYITTTRPRRSL